MLTQKEHIIFLVGLTK